MHLGLLTGPLCTLIVDKVVHRHLINFNAFIIGIFMLIGLTQVDSVPFSIQTTLAQEIISSH